VPEYKPIHHRTVSPYLIVNGAEATIAFLKRVLDAVELRRFPDESGRLMHAEVRIDDTVIMMADPAPAWPAIPSYVHVYVRDAHAAYRKALEAGAVSVQEGHRRHHLVDRHESRLISFRLDGVSLEFRRGSGVDSRRLHHSAVFKERIGHRPVSGLHTSDSVNRL